MTGTKQPLSERMAEAARALQHHHDDPGATFQASVDLAEANVEGCDFVGLSFVHARRRIDTVAATAQMAIDADQLQYELKEGPCLDAIWEQQTTYSPSLAHDRRWPTWGPRVVEETEAKSILSFQLFTHADTLGALNLYSRTRDGFPEGAREDGLAVAAHVAIAVAGAQEVAQLSQALDGRTVIGQATGILMERFDLDAVRSFALLTRLSSQGNTKLRDVAAEIVHTRKLPEG